MTGVESDVPYPKIDVARLKGDEPIRGAEPSPRADVQSYWQWAHSDIVGNVSRGVLAEYLVHLAVDGTTRARDPWADVDVIAECGVTIEVKSAAFLQAWAQTRLSNISFGIRATEQPIYAPGAVPLVSRRSDVWVFALLHHTDQATLDPLDVSQWSFWVVRTADLDRRTRSQHSIGLASLRNEFGEPIPFGAIKSAVCASAHPDAPH